jgi:putative GTP pyrophosphokinase
VDENKADVEAILAEFDGRREQLRAFCEKTKGLIEACLQDAGIRFQSVQARVKSRKKLKEKYLNPKKNYRQLDDITDLAALRIITYYEDEVDLAAEVIKREFDIDAANSVDKRESEPDRFGYYALNYVCCHSRTRAMDVEYKRFAGVYCEIQITSILRHAWSEIQHDWYDLRDAFPDDVKRRFARMAALLEIAESEFLDIRKKKGDYEKSVALQVEAEVADLALDPVSLKSFLLQDSSIRVADQLIASVFNLPLADELPDSYVNTLSMVANKAGLTTLKRLRDALQKYEKGIREFVDRSQHLWYRQPQETLPRGSSIFYLSIMLVVARPTDEILELAAQIGRNAGSPETVTLQRATAQDVIAKYSR